MYLYLKEHNTSGLKYLGVTKNNPHTYKGSGKHWKSHLKVHGNDVTTRVLLETDCTEELKREGIRYSHLWDIVDSPLFANLTVEEGQGGNTGNQWEKGLVPWNAGKVGVQAPWSEERKQKQRERMIAHHAELGHVGYIKKGHARVDMTTALNTIMQQCPHCGKSTNIGNLNRWHLDNCKSRPNDDTDS